MFELRCTVRGCHETLTRHDDGLRCSSGHHFDRAKAGYWSLLQPQDRKSLKPGDSDDAVLARQSWLARGHAAGLVNALQPWTKLIPDPVTNRSPRTLDLGCGEGSFGLALFPGEADGYCGIDLSKRAIKLAARRWPQATWVCANADRQLPAADQSVDRVISLFGRRPVSEIKRVLTPTGISIVAVPGAEDLIELRESVQSGGHHRSRWELVAEEFSAAGLDLLEHRLWQERIELEPDAIADALAMTYRAVRHSEHAKAESLVTMQVTLAADLMLLGPRAC
ncbi:MAG: methyltransferase domain-containing protein [Planctomycetales bacterium]|nr:methyltransferase domain-containing protein [Planctomycetales bacterium]